MIRRIIKIDEEKCTGCGLCADACHERAIAMVDGKAKLIRDDYCDGLGDCLPACPADAISFEEREALPYDKEAVENAKLEEVMRLLSMGCASCKANGGGSCSSGGCSLKKTAAPEEAPKAPVTESPSALRQWPVQIQLVPVKAPYFDGADLLIAADCTAYAYGNFHKDFMTGRVTVIGCPKLDEIDYAEKLTRIFTENDIKTVTLTRMHVPCCGGMERAVRAAIEASGKTLPLTVVTIDNEGKLL